jgi:sortase (surface protein transpeptidase)
MPRPDRFTPRNIIQKKYQRTRGWLVSTVGVATLSLVALVSISVIDLPDLLTETVVYNNNQAGLASQAVEQEASSIKPGDSATQDLATATSSTERPIPLTLSIPSLNLRADFTDTPLGLGEERAVEVPNSYTEVGWYGLGPTPGDQGPAIVLGHVDSIEGPAVLYDLKELAVGDSIYIERDDGIVTRFIVESLDTPSQAEFPTEAVYENLDYAALRIITCTGTYLEDEMRYTHNLVVTARLVGLDFENTIRPPHSTTSTSTPVN